MTFSTLVSGSSVVRALLAIGCVMSVTLAGCASEPGGAEPLAATSPDASPGDGFNLAEFTAAVNAAARAHGSNATALPAVQMPSPTGMSPRLQPIMAQAFAVRPEAVIEETAECDAANEAACVERFVREVAGFNQPFATELTPLARQLLPIARDLRVSVWRPAQGGGASSGAVTLCGRRDDHLVGIIVFR